MASRAPSTTVLTSALVPAFPRSPAIPDAKAKKTKPPAITRAASNATMWGSALPTAARPAAPIMTVATRAKRPMLPPRSLVQPPSATRTRLPPYIDRLVGNRFAEDSQCLMHGLQARGGVLDEPLRRHRRALRFSCAFPSPTASGKHLR